MVTNTQGAVRTGAHAARIAVAALAVLAALVVKGTAGGSAAPFMQLPEDPRSWTDKVAPDVVALAGSSSSDLDVLVKFREPYAVHALSVAAQGAPVRIKWIADTADVLERDWYAGGVRVLHRYSHVASVHVSVPAALLAAFAEDPRVDAVVLNRKVRALDATGSAYVHVTAIQPPNSGSGVGIAILDTGVDYTHAELSPLGTKTIALYDAYHSTGDAAYAKDDNGHGTQVAGIAAAAGVNAAAIGTAPAATIVSVKILDSTGSGTENSIVQGINAVISSVNGGNPYNIRAANLSLGGYFSGSGAAGVPDQPCDSQDSIMATAFQQLTNANVVPVVAGGNGTCTNGVSWPACISTSLAVGSVYDQTFQFVSFSDSFQCNAPGTTGCKDTDPAAGTVVCYSDSGDKLDVWAPTGAITPTKGGGYSSDNTQHPYFWGTSASTPYASGLVALLAHASPSTSAANIKLAIRGSGNAITDSRNNITRNLIQADQAVAALACTPPDAPSNIGANIASTCSGEQVVLSWTPVAGADSYTVQVSADSSFANPSSSTTTSATYIFSTTQTTSGTFYFRVEASSSCGASAWSSVVQVTYTPQCSTSYVHTYYLSGIAHTPGVSPAFWYSDVSILNAGTSSASVRVTFYGVNSAPPAQTFTLGGGQQTTWTDVLGSLFGLSQDKGMLVVDSTVPLQTISRTYSMVTNGATVTTFGQAYVGIEAGQALTTATTGWFPALRSDGVFRTNLEFVNTSAVPTDVRIAFYTATGTPIGTTTITVPALHWTQVVRALVSGQASAFAKVQVLVGGAQILGSASVVDGNSTDPTTIPMWVQ